jgi:protein ImuA
MPTAAAARAELARLRRQIARLEGKPADSARLICLPDGETRIAGAGEQPGQGGRLAFGVPRLDAALGGGLARGTLHEVRTAESRDGATALGFVLAALAAFTADVVRPPAILWIAEATSRREAGELYLPGLEALGLDPAWIVRVAVRRPAEALWAFEAGLACGGLAFAVCELGRTSSVQLTASRRAALRARASGVTGLILRIGAAAEPSAAETRLAVAPAPSRPEGAFAGGLGRPAWRLEIEKSRGGRIGIFTVEWSPDARRFSERGTADGRLGTEPRHLPVAAAPCDRPAAAAGWKRAG